MIRPVDPPVQAPEKRAGTFADAAQSAGLDAPPAAAPPTRRFSFAPMRQGALIPNAGAAGASLTAVIAIISALAALALAALALITVAASAWTEDLEGALTVQVKGADAEDIDSRAQTLFEMLQATPGVVDARLITSAEAAKKLEPWLGKDNSGFLNVPALIEITADPSIRTRIDELRANIESVAPGAALDDHSAWNDRLSRAARTGQGVAFGIFALVLIACCAIAAFAARAGLAANAEIISILHLVGATDDFVANEVQRRFLSIGLRGSLAGVIGAGFVIGLVALAARARGAGGYFAPVFDLGPDLILPMLIAPLAICLAIAVSARLTVLGALRREY